MTAGTAAVFGSTSGAQSSATWLTALRRYIGFLAPAHLAWEFAHMPLYTLWTEGSRDEIVFAAVHCAGGDLLIAIMSLVAALVVFGTAAWPRSGGRRIVALTVAFGLIYTIFSEWLNTEIRGSWAYSELMPVVPVLGAGLSPLLQWIILPLAAFWWASRRQASETDDQVGTKAE